MSPSRSSFRYQVLSGLRSEDDKETLSSAYRWVGWVGVMLLATIALLVSYWAGRRVSTFISCSKENYGLLGIVYHIRLLSLLLSISSAAAPPGTIHQVWEHQPIFSQDLTPESEAAWSSVIPIGRGFVYHPQVTPVVANIAVFHQLHCLHTLRVGYYTKLYQLNVLNGINTSKSFDEHMAITPEDVHMRHCFDYLRQALMCAADTNLEKVSPETHITTGWGSDKVCRDYWRIFAWAEQWANSSDTGII
ncbi:conserved hypothetical protein [Talaromyces stipitatus ATCC 10500]|uniref:Tat pathway signal sequence n=1 Tax=Talaromyces stipitatus (strain ATCC 10500 / CBS 375.48 / QM 6759 / NRRL 1006) TaxID=441959 RepID=B8MGY8_TALSN|nr:uncharacterized protein TSTA_014610 [Talaromyces stipitatus ATCC 10500]EED16369.1 conserved hypothetical protein [Talaromyces stipitatus ATCC 10500]